MPTFDFTITFADIFFVISFVGGVAFFMLRGRNDIDELKASQASIVASLATISVDIKNIPTDIAVLTNRVQTLEGNQRLRLVREGRRSPP